MWYSDNGENGVLWSLEKWDENLECDVCQVKGSYYMVNEKYVIGVCLEHMNLENNVNADRSTLFFKITYTDSDSLEGILPVCIHGKNWSWTDNACLICGKNGIYNIDPMEGKN